MRPKNDPDVTDSPERVARGSSSVSGYAAAVVVSTVLRERENIRAMKDYAVDAALGILGLFVSVIVVFTCPILMPISVIRNWKNINHGEVNRRLKAWTGAKRHNNALSKSHENKPQKKLP
jgi:hypothetical protein